MLNTELGDKRFQSPGSSNMKIFLTGGTGLIGQPLTHALLRRGWTVVALARNPHSPESQAIQSAGAHLVRGDVTDRESMRTGMSGVDAVIHNAGWYELGITRSAQARMRAINVSGTDNTLGLAVELKIPKIVYTSTIGAFGATADTLADESYERRRPFRSFYEQSKTEAHALATRYQQQGAPLIIICPSHVIGPGDQSAWGWFVRMYVRRILPPFGFARNTKLSCVSVEDVAEAIALAVEKGQLGHTYITSGEEKTMEEIIGIWAKTPGGSKPLVWLPYPIAMAVGIIAEPFLRLIGLPAFLSRESIESAYENWLYTAAKAERELGAKFRNAEQLWQETLAAERALARRK
ncbi:MAG TPA: SDR family NAD(P)-dependent oxidoreductase [Anaerolineae bacterium]|nr:SDR family NAD(P)-dependent oxidoreductase [Anaerolineae bacterium]